MHSRQWTLNQLNISHFLTLRRQFSTQKSKTYLRRIPLMFNETLFIKIIYTDNFIFWLLSLLFVVIVIVLGTAVLLLDEGEEATVSIAAVILADLLWIPLLLCYFPWLDLLWLYAPQRTRLSSEFPSKCFYLANNFCTFIFFFCLVDLLSGGSVEELALFFPVSEHHTRACNHLFVIYLYFLAHVVFCYISRQL